MTDIEKMIDRRERRRFASEAAAYDRLDRQLNDADALIGELASGTLYINVRSKNGAMTGRIRKFNHRSDAASYLIRNRYV